MRSFYHHYVALFQHHFFRLLPNHTGFQSRLVRFPRINKGKIRNMLTKAFKDYGQTSIDRSFVVLYKCLLMAKFEKQYKFSVAPSSQLKKRLIYGQKRANPVKNEKVTFVASQIQTWMQMQIEVSGLSFYLSRCDRAKLDSKCNPQTGKIKCAQVKCAVIRQFDLI